MRHYGAFLDVHSTQRMRPSGAVEIHEKSATYCFCGFYKLVKDRHILSFSHG
jgi:hypothetical protein